MPSRVIVKVPPKANPKLAQALAEPPDPINHRCRIGEYIDKHPNGDEINMAVGNPKWSAILLAKALHGFSVKVSPTIINDHRATRCICYRENK